MLQFDTPETLSEMQTERWARGRRTLSELESLDLLGEATMSACDQQGRWWQVGLMRADDGVTIEGPQQVDFDEAPADCWRMEIVLTPPVDFGVFVQMAIRFPDATLILPEMAVEAGECGAIQRGGDLDLVTIFEI